MMSNEQWVDASNKAKLTTTLQTIRVKIVSSLDKVIKDAFEVGCMNGLLVVGNKIIVN